MPPGLSFVEAAAIPETFFTVWTNVFDRGRLAAGEADRLRELAAQTPGTLRELLEILTAIEAADVARHGDPKDVWARLLTGGASP